MINLKFNKVIIHHFLSFDHAEISLTDKGYCLVSGINRNPKDSARSNGAGKSTVFNAISYALTGETLQGLKSNLGNIYFNDGCWVSLNFTVDGHEYTLLRSKEDDTYGTNLKITVDGEDKSGKGIRESQLVLDQLLPDLTSELLGSVVMIGQGMPMKFTANTPSGRKEVLEHLSQSDYMIQDLKERIAARSSKLSKDIREMEDAILALNSQQEVYNRQLTFNKTKYDENYSTTPDFDSKIKDLEKVEEDYRKANTELSTVVTSLKEQLGKKNPELVNITKEKNSYATKFDEEHKAAYKELSDKRIAISTEIMGLEQEINRLKNIKDVCPTCGQKIPNVIKPDTTELETHLSELKQNKQAIDNDIEEDQLAYDAVVTELNEKFENQITNLQAEVNNLNTELLFNESKMNLNSNKINETVLAISNVKKDKEFFNTNKENAMKAIIELENNIKTLENNAKEKQEALIALGDHMEVVKKMTTIITRDFRGFLLKSIIEYINAKAKEYTAKIFGCDEIEFVLDGNNIDISFCNKDYENLSGGEKQRVDLIVQFAIRDFMSQYLQFSSNILVLDEITDALDADSCDKVINFITNELNDIESVFIISHHADELSIPVDSEIIIEKNMEGVSSIA